MRMWMLPPAGMCRKHLLGEHVELHMLLGSLRRGKNIEGFLSGGLVDPQSIFARHEELVAEIGACMLCATLGLVPDFDQSAAYVKGWLEALANDSRMIFRAASDAQKAIDFIAAAAEAGQAVLAA